MGSFGPQEILIVLLVALVVFGSKRLPELGRSLGGGLRGFKRGITGEPDAEPAAIPTETPR